MPTLVLYMYIPVVLPDRSEGTHACHK